MGEYGFSTLGLLQVDIETHPSNARVLSICRRFDVQKHSETADVVLLRVSRRLWQRQQEHLRAAVLKHAKT
eukprot:NODE_3952_length_368_cov_665.965517_g3374_i0.p2 GENE.NODE_3952_length_368_cov_665.965517_g3374_i0~~NODE_3952_length_368_cov_665.965517_g3374_i0.p2  ORF type:complete len:81 (-),score=21.41 NODE_3952_length_368_cov_665.965517_g3374_i0:124-336(-)